uniref:Uncharacterized protein n=1 Tax=Romanomermis culicivorax TaxID=13658 RepID=A0A915JXB4_ROMCU
MINKFSRAKNTAIATTEEIYVGRVEQKSVYVTTIVNGQIGIMYFQWREKIASRIMVQDNHEL